MDTRATDAAWEAERERERRGMPKMVPEGTPARTLPKYSMRSASSIVTKFMLYHEEYVMRGAAHPDLRDWHAERFEMARERLIALLRGEADVAKRFPMPPRPEVEYDR